MDTEGHLWLMVDKDELAIVRCQKLGLGGHGDLR